MITPRTLKGFRDLLPDQAALRERILATAIDVYRRYGFVPIDTPALEYTEILLGKGGAESDKQMYRFEDHGGRDVAMRFDLTVPFARYAAQHIGVLGTPFKRYHAGPVWRGENTQRGRYREFWQCDFDTIGTESELADLETLLVIADLFTALDVGGFTVRFNDRRVLNGLMDSFGVGDRATDVLRAIDKLPKLGRDAVAGELVALVGADAANEITELSSVSGSNAEVLDRLDELTAESELGAAGAGALRRLVDRAGAAGVAGETMQIDVSIARGLDYYTGVVFETFLDDLPDIGSCCSGGRYDDLASLYTKQRLPGVGAALGVDRLLAAIEELGRAGQGAAAAVLVTVFDEDGIVDAVTLAAELRNAGIAAELYPEARKLGTQLRYADRRGHRLALIAGPKERAEERVQVKDLVSGDAATVDRTGIVSAVNDALGKAEVAAE